MSHVQDKMDVILILQDGVKRICALKKAAEKLSHLFIPNPIHYLCKAYNASQNTLDVKLSAPPSAVTAA
jgi:hypothetical protein